MGVVAASIIVLLFQLFLGLLLAILSVYLSLRFFDKMTEGIDEIAELKKGNVAIAIVLASLVISVATIVNQGVSQIESIFTSTLSLPFFIIALIMAIVQLVVVVLIAVLTIYVSIRVLDTLTVGIDELKELKKGNLAVAIEIGAVIYVVSLIVSGAISGLEGLAIFRPETLARLLGVI